MDLLKIFEIVSEPIWIEGGLGPQFVKRTSPEIGVSFISKKLFQVSFTSVEKHLFYQFKTSIVIILKLIPLSI